MVTISSSSPYHQQHSSPYSLSVLLEQHCNQCVPSSPSLSPFIRHHGAFSQKLLPSSSGSARAGSSPAAAQVPELVQGENTSNTASSGNRAVYSGSPLLRQILRVGRKRQYEGEGGSPLTVSAGMSPSPSAGPSSSKRARLESPASRVPNSVIIVERKQTYYKTKGLEQVVPNTISPLERQCKVRSGVDGSRSNVNGDGSPCKRQLPTNKEGVKPLDLFSGDEIFPNHNEE